MGLWTAVFAAFLGLMSVAASDEEGVSRICQPAPPWKIEGHSPMQDQASRLGGLRAKLSRRGLSEVGFLIVNENEPQARAMYWELKRRAPKGVPVYQQDPLQQDVWETLGGDKDDFLIYDRCGKLAFHIPLPYSFLHRPYIEAAVLATYHKDICGNCSVHLNSTLTAGPNGTNVTSINATATDSLMAQGAPDIGHTNTTGQHSHPDKEPPVKNIQHHHHGDHHSHKGKGNEQPHSHH